MEVMTCNGVQWMVTCGDELVLTLMVMGGDMAMVICGW